MTIDITLSKKRAGEARGRGSPGQATVEGAPHVQIVVIVAYGILFVVRRPAIEYPDEVPWSYFFLNSSISKIKVAFGGIKSAPFVP